MGKGYETRVMGLAVADSEKTIYSKKANSPYII